MKVEVLQAFVAAAEQRSFSKAGETLYLSQPTVSRYIADLEKQMGGALFERNAHTCELTLLGKQVFVHAKRMLNEWECIQTLKSGDAESKTSRVRIGYTYQEMLQIITPALSEIGASSVKTELSVRFGDGSDISRLVHEGMLDCAVMHLPSVSNLQGLSVRLICKCGMSFHAPEGHRLAGYDTVKLEQLIHETDVRIASEKGFYRMADEAFSGLNLPVMKHVYVERASDCMPITRFMKHICLNPEIYPAWPGCRMVKIEDWTTDFSLVFVTREDYVSDATERLYKALCTSMK